MKTVDGRQQVTDEEYQTLVEMEDTIDYANEEPCERCGEMGMNCPEWLRVALLQIRGE